MWPGQTHQGIVFFYLPLAFFVPVKKNAGSGHPADRKVLVHHPFKVLASPLLEMVYQYLPAGTAKKT